MLLKPIEAFYTSDVEIAFLKFPRRIIALTEPLTEQREPVGPFLTIVRDVTERTTNRYILQTGYNTTSDDYKVFKFRAAKDAEAIRIANQHLELWQVRSA